MTDTQPAPHLETPAAVAAAVLDAIERHPNAFDMQTWFSPLPDSNSITPGSTVDCGTTMCVAGWAAHLTGWTLIDDEWATKADATRYIENVGAQVLGLLPDEADDLFRTDDEDALTRLRTIAGS